MANARQGWDGRVCRRVACGLLTVVAGSAFVVGSAVPAQAAPPGSLYLDGLLAATAVGAAVPFTASLTNDGADQVSKIRLVLRITATGIESQRVRVERRELDGTWTIVANRAGSRGDVRFVDDSYRDRAMGPGGALTGRYRLTVLAGTPPGLAIVSVVAEHQTEDGWQGLANSPQYLTHVEASMPPGSQPGGQGASADATAFPSPAATVQAVGVGGGQSAGSDPDQHAGQSADPEVDLVGAVVATRVPQAADRPAPGSGRSSARLALLGGVGVVLVLLVVAVRLLRRQVYGGQDLDVRVGGGGEWRRDL
ncbi:MAG: hypothetical protein HKP61_15030 [Dactylosporangium sp.]|nr:hypothetical protein [Dactylosporangium sp.]NNJ62224.1 hypothetical protein [Dactylosporangium sp.]